MDTLGADNNIEQSRPNGKTVQRTNNSCSWSESRRSTRLSACATCIVLAILLFLGMSIWKFIEEKQTIKPVLEWNEGRGTWETDHMDLGTMQAALFLSLAVIIFLCSCCCITRRRGLSREFGDAICYTVCRKEYRRYGNLKLRSGEVCAHLF